MKQNTKILYLVSKYLDIVSRHRDLVLDLENSSTSYQLHSTNIEQFSIFSVRYQSILILTICTGIP